MNKITPEQFEEMAKRVSWQAAEDDRKRASRLVKMARDMEDPKEALSNCHEAIWLIIERMASEPSPGMIQDLRATAWAAQHEARAIVGLCSMDWTEED